MILEPYFVIADRISYWLSLKEGIYSLSYSFSWVIRIPPIVTFKIQSPGLILLFIHPDFLYIQI